MTIMQKGIPVRLVTLAVMLAAAPALGQNINIDVGAVFGTPTAAYGAGAGQIGVWNTVNGAIATPQALNDINGVPVGATFQINAGNFDFNFNNTGTAGDDQALMDDGADMGTTDVDTITIANLNAGNYSVYTYAWAPDSATFITVVNVNGLGAQNVGGVWPGAQTEGITYSLHNNVVTPAGGSITITLTQGVSFKTLNGIQLVAGANDQGRCCDPSGDCAITTEEACNAPSVFGGLGTNCAGNPCRGRCCDSSGFCEVTGPADCTAPSIFGGLGTTCAGAEPCRGRCCSPTGECSLTTEANCPAPSTFGGLGSNCDGDPCRGRCCQAGGFCEVTGPADCAAPGVFGGLGTNCSAVNTYGNPSPIPVVMPLAGAAPPSFITVPDSVIIQDLDVYVLVQHTWRDDAVIRLQGPDGTIVPLTGTADGICGSEDNLNAIFDDEGAAVDVATCANPALASLAGPPVRIMTTPAGGLGVFDGQNGQGQWTLLANDIIAADSGSVLDWALFIDSGQPCGAAGCTCFGDMNGDSSVNGADIPLFATCVAAGGAGCPCGDMDHAGGATSADVTAFVTAVLTSTCGTP